MLNAPTELDCGSMHYALDDVDLTLLTSPPRPATHRRHRSDPTDINWTAIREARDGPFGPPASALKRELSPMATHSGFSPASKKQASLMLPLTIVDDQARLDRTPSSSNASDDEGDGSEPAVPHPATLGIAPLPISADEPMYAHVKKEPNYNKKDVPMWTVEEDLLILQLVEQHGKRWSKIAAHLPGRTDNGVRNRWNRMERAQLIKKGRAPGAGYRCRRCGEPKRGHICAARMMLGETPEGEDLHMKAAALTEISKAALKTSVEMTELTDVQRFEHEPLEHAAMPTPPPPPPARPGSGHDGGSSAAPLATNGVITFATPQPPMPTATAPPPLSAAKSNSTSFVAAADAVENLDLALSSDVNDFLEQLRAALDDATPPTPASPTKAAAAAPPPMHALGAAAPTGTPAGAWGAALFAF